MYLFAVGYILDYTSTHFLEIILIIFNRDYMRIPTRCDFSGNFGSSVHLLIHG